MKTLVLSVESQVAIKIIDGSIHQRLRALSKIAPSRNVETGTLTYHIPDLFHVRDIDLLADIEELIGIE